MEERVTEGGEAPGWKVWVALWTVYIVWGSTYLAIRVAVETLPPFLHASVRFLIAGALLYLFVLMRHGARAVKVTPPEVAAAAFVGTALLLGGNGLVAVAEQEVPSSLAALIIASVPLWVVVMRVVVGDNVRRGTLIGVVVGFAGVAILLSPGSVEGVPFSSQLVVLGASLCWATGSFTSPRLPLPRNQLTSTAVQMLCGGAALFIASALRGEFGEVRPERFSTASLIAVVYLVLAGSLAAFTAYTWLLQHAPISKVSTYAYVNPVVAVLLGWLFASESVTLPIAIGAAIVVASVAFTVRQESRPRSAAPAPEAVETARR